MAIVPLYAITSGNKSSATDLDQLVTLLNGTGTATLMVSNRITATTPGATASSALIGGVSTKGDRSQNRPSTQPDSAVKPAPPVSGSYQKGDVAVDRAGLFWLATANTSGTTPWVSAGRGGDSARTRCSILSGTRGGGGSPLGPTQFFANWDWGGIQYNFSGGVGTSGFLIPTTGYYNLTCTVKATTMGANTRYTVNWIKGTSIFSSGDLAQSDGGPTNDAGSVSDDICQLNAGDFIAPFVTLTGATPTLGTAASDPTPDDFTIYAVLQLLSASSST